MPKPAVKSKSSKESSSKVVSLASHREAKLAKDKKQAVSKSRTKKGKELPFVRERAWEDFQGLVKWVSARIASKCRNFVTMDDLISVGSIGLLKAMDRFDPKKKAQFRTYAVIKIRGEILDYIRKNYPRQVSQQIKAKEFVAARDHLQHKLKRNPTVEEIAKHLEVTVDDVHQMEELSHNVQFVAWDDIAERNDSLGHNHAALSQNASVLSNITNNELFQKLREAMETMPEKVREALTFMYFEDMSQIEVAQRMNLSPSRVSQLHSEGITLLQMQMNASDRPDKKTAEAA